MPRASAGRPRRRLRPTRPPSAAIAARRGVPRRPTDDAAESKPPVAVKVDFDGLDQRIVAMPIEPGPYGNLIAGKEGQIFYLRSASPAGGPGSLRVYDLEKREEKTLLPAGVNGFSLSGDRAKVLFNTADGWAIAKITPEPIDPSKGKLPIDQLEVKVDPAAEWPQIFNEAWRINRDYFYDPGMHGADWPAMREKYAAFLPHVVTRRDLNRVIQWMCSELAVGHHRVAGGDERLDRDDVPGGLLGADFEIADGRYRFAKVFGGLNWNPTLRAPLTAPGVDVVAGEYLLAVDGRELFASEEVYSRFEKTAGKNVEITVGPNPDGKGSRTVTVVPIDNEGASTQPRLGREQPAPRAPGNRRPRRLRLRAEHRESRTHLLQALLLPAGGQGRHHRRRAAQRRRSGG